MLLEDQLKIKKVSLSLEDYGLYKPIFSNCPYRNHKLFKSGNTNCSESSNRIFYAKYTSCMFYIPCKNHLEIAIRYLIEVE